MKNFSSLQEDLRKWFSKTDPAGDWKRINSKGEVAGPCAREPGEPKPKCMSRAKRESLTKKERASAVRAKRKYDPDPERKGEPINVSNFGKGKISENMENLEEKNVPTNPSLWSQAKSLARSKFDVYPSAYANGWASKWYKGKGGSWKSVSEAVKDKYDEGEYDQEGDMAKSDLRSIMANAKELHDMIDDADNLPEWCQSKITLAEDYISTVANYMAAEMSEEVMQEAAYVVKHDGVSSDHADANAKKLFVGKTNVNSHMTKYASSAEKHANMLKSKGFKNVRIQTMNKEEVEQIAEISKTTLGSYVKRASQDAVTKAMKYASKHDESGKESGTLKKISNRESGVMKAIGRLTKEEIENDDQAVSQLKSALLSKKEQIQSATKDQVYDIINKMMTSIAKTNDISGKQLHDQWVKQYKQVPDKWIMNESVEPITELSSDTLDRYKEKAKKSSDSLASQGKYRQANDRTMNVMKATGKQIDKTVANIRKSLNNDATPAQRSLQPNNKTMVRESRRLEIVREAMVDAKKKDRQKKIEKKVDMNGLDKFQSDPELSSQVIKNNI